MRKTLAACATVGITGLMLISPAAAQEGSVYEGQLWPLNNSGASGDAQIVVSDDGETMTVTVNAEGLNLDGPHAMHLHGIVEDGEVMASTCPTAADDADGDGVLTVLEGAPKYGSVQVSLTTEGDTSGDSALAVERYPAGTSVDYVRADIPIPDDLKDDVGRLHVVVHGIDENGNGELDLDQEERSSLTDDLPREGTAPALCGTLSVSATGPIQTGAGGLAEDDSATDAALLGGLGLAGIAAVTVRTRRRITA